MIEGNKTKANTSQEPTTKMRRGGRAVVLVGVVVFLVTLVRGDATQRLRQVPAKWTRPLGFSYAGGPTRVATTRVQTAIHFRELGVILAVRDSNPGLYRSQDNGRTWMGQWNDPYIVNPKSLVRSNQINHDSTMVVDGIQNLDPSPSCTTNLNKPPLAETEKGSGDQKNNLFIEVPNKRLQLHLQQVRSKDEAHAKLGGGKAFLLADDVVYVTNDTGKSWMRVPIPYRTISEFIDDAEGSYYVSYIFHNTHPLHHLTTQPLTTHTTGDSL